MTTFFHNLRRTALLLIILPLLLFTSLFGQNGKTINTAALENVLREAQSLLYQKQYAQAQQFLDQTLSKDSGTASFRSRAFALKAASLLGLGKSDAASAVYETAYWQGRSALENDANAAKAYEQVFLQSLVQSALQGKLALAAAAAAQSSTVRATADTLLRLNPDNGTALYHRAYVLFQEQQYDSAAQDFRHASEVLPPLQAASAYFHLGLCYFSNRKPNDAEKAFAKAISLAPFHAESYFYHGCTNTSLERFPAAIKDFTNALRYNPSDGASMGMLGSLLINAGQRQEGCARLARASQLGYTPAIDLLERYCNNAAEDGSKIVRLPTVTVEADRNINYGQRVKNTKQSISMGQRINPQLPTLRNMLGKMPLAGTTTLSDGSTLVHAANPLANSGMLPLQSMINPADCNGSVINTRSFVSVQCIAYVIRQETEPFKHKPIEKIARRLQQVADEITIQMAMMGSLGATARAANVETAGDNTFGGDAAQLNNLYREFQMLLRQLQYAVTEYEAVLKAEGKIQDNTNASK